ncbi:MAG: ubiquitin-like domain-containing protein [Anaerolineae bacterium]|nr:ubiquitin-like domain-containing protein [Anaerolineae bacterium]MDQ7035853.1 ubiquitin-like domain-containing protein [Anaerolineae bacterium]
MPSVEPPIAPDDTLPTPIYNRPTEPHRPKTRFLPNWALLALITLAALSIIVTLTLVLRDGEPITTTSIYKNITLVADGDVRDIDSQAATVGDLLREQTIQLDENDAISISLDALLVEGMRITINRARTVTLVIDEEQRTINTPFTNPQDILNNQAIILNPSDLVWLDGTAAEQSAIASWSVPVNEIVIQRAISITIVDGASEIIIDTTSDTVGDVLFEAGIVVYLTDIVSPNVSTTLAPDTRIVIDRARPVTIQVDRTTIETRVQGATVLDALSEAGIALVGLDYTIPPETEPVTADMTIHVLRVTEEIVSTEESIPYDSTMQADPNLELDQRRILQSGQEGMRRIDERLRYENGVEVGREPAGSEITQAPQNEIIAYGTQIIVRSMDTPQGTVEYWRRLRVYATSYKPEALGGDNITAIGMTLQHGIIGANPRIIPYRTNLYVADYGIGIMADTGGARSSPYWIDLGYSDEDYVAWHGYVDIYLLTPIPENVNYLLPPWRPMRGLPDN